MSSPIIRVSHRRVHGVLAVLAAAVAAACDSSDPVAVRSETAVVEGRVASVSSASAAPAAASGISLLAGIEVSVEGSNAATTTDASGNFRLEVEVDGTEPVVLRFRTALLDVRIEVDGVTPGSTVRLAVSLSAQGGTIIDRDDGRYEDFEGVATFVSITGEAPSRTLRVRLVSATRTSHVDIVEGETVFDAEGDVVSFAALLVAFDRADLTVRVEGDGMVRDGGATLATFVKVETDEPDGSSGDGSGSGSGGDAMGQVEFRGSAVLVSTVGTAPTRTLRVRVEGELHGDARVWFVDLVEGETEFDASGDFLSVDAVLAAFASFGVVERLEGVGTMGAEAIVAATARAESD